ncbi:hypothetical protein BC828DRAFT_72846 [Blastocladiella britannica]|nr:hypothetical protein BC828DRAFT_72846 [Blastocladiella britannica]
MKSPENSTESSERESQNACSSERVSSLVGFQEKVGSLISGQRSLVATQWLVMARHVEQVTSTQLGIPNWMVGCCSRACHTRSRVSMRAAILACSRTLIKGIIFSLPARCRRSHQSTTPTSTMVGFFSASRLARTRSIQRTRIMPASCMVPISSSVSCRPCLPRSARSARSSPPVLRSPYCPSSSSSSMLSPSANRACKEGGGRTRNTSLSMDTRSHHQQQSQVVRARAASFLLPWPANAGLVAVLVPPPPVTLSTACAEYGNAAGGNLRSRQCSCHTRSSMGAPAAEAVSTRSAVTVSDTRYFRLRYAQSQSTTSNLVFATAIRNSLGTCSTFSGVITAAQALKRLANKCTAFSSVPSTRNSCRSPVRPNRGMWEKLTVMKCCRHRSAACPSMTWQKTVSRTMSGSIIMIMFLLIRSSRKRVPNKILPDAGR